MHHLTPEQRYDLYQQEAQRAGIHPPILIALYEVHGEPMLVDGETGLGVIPANQVAPEQVNTFAGQVKYAANTVRSLTNGLIAQGWQGDDFWQPEAGCYSRLFLQAIANGYEPVLQDPRASRLERCDLERLQTLYGRHVLEDWGTAGVSPNQTYLDQSLRSQAEQLPAHYFGLSYQRQAILEMVRLWYGLDDSKTAIVTLSHGAVHGSAYGSALRQSTKITDNLTLDMALLQFLQQTLPTYVGYPHQRQALLGLIQKWYQLDSQPATLRTLQQGFTSAHNLDAIDTALITFVQAIPQTYEAKGSQRNALVEGFRLWHQMDNRPAALIALGVNPALFAETSPPEAALERATTQTDRAALDFVRHIPTLYDRTPCQRQALIHLAQLWQGTAAPEQTIRTLIDRLKQIETARKDSPDQLPAPPPLEPLSLELLSLEPLSLEPSTPTHPWKPVPSQSDRWTPDNLRLHAPILAKGSFTWAQATRGGLYWPPNQRIVDGMVEMAVMAELARDRIGRPLTIIRWYTPGHLKTEISQFPPARHALGTGIDFYCDGLTGRQLYWCLAPWWPGGLGHYRRYPYLCYIEVGGDRSRMLFSSIGDS